MLNFNQNHKRWFSAITTVVMLVVALIPIKVVSQKEINTIIPSEEGLTEEIEVMDNVENTMEIILTPELTIEATLEPTIEPTLTPEPIIVPTSTPYVKLNNDKKWTHFDLSDEDKYLLAVTIRLEGGGETDESQLAIGSTILNRLKCGHWGNTLHDVIYAKKQFSVAPKIASSVPGQKQLEIVEQLCKNGCTLPYYVMYFRADYYFSWATPYVHYDRTYFSYLSKDI